MKCLAERLEPRRLLASAGVPRPDHVVIVFEENHGYGDIIGSPAAPYINSLAEGGASFTDFHGITHPSQPNYIAFFSGATHGVSSNATPEAQIGAANLGSGLLEAGLSFVGYSQSLPFPGFAGDRAGQYFRKHAPWVSFSNVPAESNQPFTAFPSNYDELPTVSIVVPDQDHDMHDGSVATADTWLRDNLDPYREWARTHNSLLIVTWDEDDGDEGNRIPTIFSGTMVEQGQYGGNYDLYNLLRTLEDMYDLPLTGAAQTATPLTEPWVAATVPSITSQPEDVTVTEGAAATFTVAAAYTGQSPLAYQWRRNGAAIPGATAPTYTASGVTTADNGSTFSVRVTNAAGAVDSREATLTVSEVDDDPASVPPSGLRGTRFSATRVDLAWTDNPGDHAGYRAERAQSADGPWATIGTTAEDVTTFSDTGVAPGMSYFYRVVETDLDGPNDYSETLTVFTPSYEVVFDPEPETVALAGSRGTALVHVTHRGSSKAPAYAMLYASADDTLDAGDTPLLKTPAIVRLKQEKSKRLTLKFDYPAVGDFRLIARVSATANTAPVRGTTDALVASDSAIHVSPPTIVFGIAALTATRESFALGQRMTVSLLINNQGNTAYKGPLNIVLQGVLDGGSDRQTFFGTSQRVVLRPATEKTLKLTFTPPATVPGVYRLYAQVTGQAPAGVVIVNATAEGAGVRLTA